MKLNLEKDIVFIDIETTGLSTSKDQIVSLALIKIFADGSPTIERYRLIKPTIPIPIEASNIHGIFDKDVENQPTFKQVAKGLLSLIGDADFGGYNSNRFDIPLLQEEFCRAGFNLDLTGRKFVDSLRIFHKMERRNLAAAYKFYCGKPLEKAHDALADIKATVEILESQLDKYKGIDFDDEKEVIQEPIKNDINALHDFCNDKKEIDFQGKAILNSEGVAVFNFGKYQGKPVGERLAKDGGYFNWIMTGDFTTDTKNVMVRLKNEFNEQSKK